MSIPENFNLTKRTTVILQIHFVWHRQCSECDSSESEEDVDVDVLDNTPISQSRQRRVIKEPTKFTPDKPEVHSGARFPRLLAGWCECVRRVCVLAGCCLFLTVWVRIW